MPMVMPFGCWAACKGNTPGPRSHFLPIARGGIRSGKKEAGNVEKMTALNKCRGTSKICPCMHAADDGYLLRKRWCKWYRI